MAVYGTPRSASGVLPHAGVLPLPQRHWAFTSVFLSVIVASFALIVAALYLPLAVLVTTVNKTAVTLVCA